MSFKKDFTIKIADMLMAIDEIETIIQDITLDQFKKNVAIYRATERCCEIIGEASAQIPDDFKLKTPEIEWRFIKGLRNIIAHDYGKVDYDILWTIVKVDIPNLKNYLQPHDPRTKNQ